MNQHLTWEQISDYLIGDASSKYAGQYAQHARECVSCRSEVARLQSALSEFRGAVRHWTGRMCRTDFQTSVVMGVGAGSHPGAGIHLDRLLMPDALVEQLAPDGIMVLPLGPHAAPQNLVKLTKSADGIRREELLAVRFVPLLPGQAREL